MTSESLSAGRNDRARLLALAGALRPELHRYCARLMGSVIEGEDVVQDTLERAFARLPEVANEPMLRPWLFRVAHNRALDLLRGRAMRRTDPLDAALDLADPAGPDPVEALMVRQAVETAVSRFVELPLMQRSVVVLKDVLGETLADIAALLDLTLDAVKAHLARGRARLRLINAQAAEVKAGPRAAPVSAAVARYVALFNDHDWDGLRALLADDVRLNQATHPLRTGRGDVGTFFTIYAKSETLWLSPAWLEGREVMAVFEDRADATPAYVMWLEWEGDQISYIHDYRYARYVTADAELALRRDSLPG